jgi:3-deoxy-D-manno-octulosonate 8-phosphate phosphatase (KDO 8-P phosphatase)
MPAAPIVPDDLRTRLLRLRGVALDVDGVLTDGSLTFDEDGRETKTFDVKDGMGLVLLRELGYRIGIISSRTSRVVAARCRDLKIPEESVLQGELDKAAAFDRLVAKWELTPSEVVAVGDDLPDLGMLRRAGLSACPSDAVTIVRDASALHLTKAGGCGAVRELCDLIIEVRRGARADRPASVPPPAQENGSSTPGSPDSPGDVLPFRRG